VNSSRPPERRTPLRRSGGLGRSRIKPVSDKRREENYERRRELEAAFGRFPDCVLCAPLKAAGIDTGCNGKATDGDEILSRARGGSIVDVANIRPVGRRCHNWLTTHPAKARELGLVESQFG
jgi:hypothetical protein